MSVCWKPEWCECPKCGPLVEVVDRSDDATCGCEACLLLMPNLCDRAPKNQDGAS